MILNMGERIRELRRERALTQDEVARRLNISAQAVSKWENAASYPDLELIPPLAELLGVSIDALFREDAEGKADELCRKADEMFLTPARVNEALLMLRSVTRSTQGCLADSALRCTSPIGSQRISENPKWKKTAK